MIMVWIPQQSLLMINQNEFMLSDKVQNQQKEGMSCLVCYKKTNEIIPFDLLFTNVVFHLPGFQRWRVKQRCPRGTAIQEKKSGETEPSLGRL